MSGHWTLNNEKKHINVEFKLLHNKKEISLFLMIWEILGH